MAGISSQLVLEALDPDLGGLTSGTADEIWENLTDRGVRAKLPDVRRILEALAESRSVEQVEREDGPPLYTRPEVLLKAIGILKPVMGDARHRATHP